MGCLGKVPNGIACRCYLTGSTGKLYPPVFLPIPPQSIAIHPAAVPCGAVCLLCFLLFPGDLGSWTILSGLFANSSPIHRQPSGSCTLWSCLLTVFFIISGEFGQLDYTLRSFCQFLPNPSPSIRQLYPVELFAYCVFYYFRGIWAAFPVLLEKMRNPQARPIHRLIPFEIEYLRNPPLDKSAK